MTDPDETTGSSRIAAAAALMSVALYGIYRYLRQTQTSPNQPVDSNHEHESASHQLHPTAPPFPTELQIPQTVIDAYYASDHRKDVRDRVRLVVEGLTFLAVLGAAGLGVWNLKVLTEQTRIMSQQLQVADRAWVFPFGASLLEPVTTANPVTARYWIHNVGKHPAFQVRSGAFIELLDSRVVLTPSIPEPSNRSGSTTTLGPSEAVEMAQIWMKDDRTLRLTNEEIASINDGTKRLYIGVYVEYRDLVQAPEEPSNYTFFCYMYDRSIPATIQCRDGNFTGVTTEIPGLKLRVLQLNSTGIAETPITVNPNGRIRK